jgi:hypothetical protein
MYTSWRQIPAASSISSSSRPQRPTKGRPARSSLAPGASPTTTSSACGFPSPGTRFVHVSQGSEPQPLCRRISEAIPVRSAARSATAAASAAGPGRLTVADRQLPEQLPHPLGGDRGIVAPVVGEHHPHGLGVRAKP